MPSMLPLLLVLLPHQACAFASTGLRDVTRVRTTAPAISPLPARLVLKQHAVAKAIIAPIARSNPISMQVAAEEPSEPALSAFQKFSNFFSTCFPLWTLLVAVWGVYKPALLAAIPTSTFTGLLGILMLSMGITLTLDDFKRVLEKPGVMVVGFVGCYLMMPALALGLARALGLSPALTAGMVLVGSINGGQASNLCTYIARGDVALSVMMTTVTTLGAIVMTPLISQLLLGTLVPVDAVGVALSTIQVVLLPIIAGMLFNSKFPKAVKKIEPFSPVVGVLSTCILVGSAVAQCSAPILAAGGALQFVCALLHILGGGISYFGLKKFYPETTCRTVAIETSMKSSAFGFLLAKLHFAEFLVRVPAAVSVVWMALVGSSLAVAFRFMPVVKEE